MKVNRKAIGRLLAAAILFLLCVWWGQQGREAFLGREEYLPLIILDAGHGGEDGGAISPGGTKESNVNLDVVLRLEQMLALLGEAPMLLRQEDVSLHDSSAVTLREKKVSDLKNRVLAVETNPTATLVSVHQNSYPEPKYRGAQVFYAPTGGSQRLAQAVQQAVIQHLQPDNNRKEKPIPDSVYLMNHISNQAILVECGFLTNPEEEALLQEPEYQRKLALVLASALIQQVSP